MNPPYEPAPSDRYCRLFPPTNPACDLAVMERLGLSMERETSRIPKEKERNPLPAGYPYFGQLVDHDLTPDETALPEAIACGPTPARMIHGRFFRIEHQIQPRLR